jgi:hypothetical protein
LEDLDRQDVAGGAALCRSMKTRHIQVSPSSDTLFPARSPQQYINIMAMVLVTGFDR